MFPLKNYKYEIPLGIDLGAFGVTRKFDMHTGVDLYCNEKDNVYAIEDGVIVAIKWFTGEKVNMSWWNDTQAIAIKGKSGVINYGEVHALETLKVGDNIIEGQHLGWVLPVLKTDKGKVPSISMLHIELYTEYDGKWVLWEVGTEQPKNLLNPTDLLYRSLINGQFEPIKILKDDSGHWLIVPNGLSEHFDLFLKCLDDTELYDANLELMEKFDKCLIGSINNVQLYIKK